MPAVEETKLYLKALGCLMGGLMGDAMGTPTEGKDYRDIVATFGWVEDFTGDGTDDTVMRDLLARALVDTDGYATLDDWARVWLSDWDAIFGPKESKFFISVKHTAHKLRRHSVPRMAALGNLPSSSSAMCIAPVGIVNASNPRQAALQAYNLASLIHGHDVGFCQDGAAAIATAVSAAFAPGASVASVLAAARGAIIPLSGAEMLERIDAALALAREEGEYLAFREALYDRSESFFCSITCDSRETVPLTLALLELGDGDTARCVTYAANLGRDADTIGAMVGGITGALGGIESIPGAWSDKLPAATALDQRQMAAQLCEVALRKRAQERSAHDILAQLIG